MPVEGLRPGFTIAVSGKGGVGKTAVSALLVRYLSRLGGVLAIDADPDSNLPQALGVTVATTVGEAREAILNAPARSPVAADKAAALRQALAERVEETYDYDLVVMGRSEGPGCYCAVNAILREVMDNRAESYTFTVIDCEAGLEHLSRRTTRDVDALIVVSDPTKNGLLTARRVQDLTRELMVVFGTIVLVVNKVTPETRPLVEALAQEEGLEIAYFLPYDPLVAEYDMLGRPVAQLPPDSPIVQAVAALAEGMLTAAAHT